MKPDNASWTPATMPYVSATSEPSTLPLLVWGWVQERLEFASAASGEALKDQWAPGLLS